MCAKIVENKVPSNVKTNEALSGLFLVKSGYFCGITDDKFEVESEIRLYFVVSGSGKIKLAGKSHFVQQHDVFFQCENCQLTMMMKIEYPVEIWWVDLCGPGVEPIKNTLSISPDSPIITGIHEPRFFHELKSIVMQYDLFTHADMLHITSAIYKMFGILLESSTASQWIVVPHDDERIIYTGEWVAWPSPNACHHEEYYTCIPKSFAILNFYGSGIKWLGTTNYDGGKAEIIIDGSHTTIVDTYSPERLSKQILYVNTKLKQGHHIIRILCTGAHNAKSTNCDIIIESLQYYSTIGQNGISTESTNTYTLLCNKAVRLMQSTKYNISIGKLAKTLGVSRSYFTSAFTKEMGLSPSQYMIDKRIEYSKKLLTETNLSIQEVSLMSGYNDVFYFSKLFKTKENVSPSHYRKLNNT